MFQKNGNSAATFRMVVSLIAFSKIQRYLTEDKNKVKGSKKMSKYASNYEDVTTYTLDLKDEQRLQQLQKECVFMWTTRAGEPVGVTQSFIEINGHIWMTAAEQRARIHAVRRDPRTCVCITSTGTEMGEGKTVTYKGTTIVHPKEDRKIKDMFYRTFAEKRYGDQGPEYVEQMIDYIDSPNRVVLEFIPGKKITHDRDKMEAATAPLETPSS
jgi:general stress protein 26